MIVSPLFTLYPPKLVVLATSRLTTGIGGTNLRLSFLGFYFIFPKLPFQISIFNGIIDWDNLLIEKKMQETLKGEKEYASSLGN